MKSTGVVSQKRRRWPRTSDSSLFYWMLENRANFCDADRSKSYGYFELVIALSQILYSLPLAFVKSVKG